MRFLLLFSLVLLLATEGVAQSDVIRPNWGVEFRRLGGLTSGASSWHHTFAIPFLSVSHANISMVPSCVDNRDVNICQTANDLIVEMNKQHKSFIDSIESNINMVKQLIPFQVGDMKKSKRAILDFVSTIGKSLFGFAKNSDVKILVSHINQIETNENITSHQLIQLGTQLSSFMNTTNKRIDNAMEGVADNHNLIMKLNRVVTSNAKSVTFITNVIGQLLKTQIITSSTFGQIEREVQNWVLGAQTLLEGYFLMQFVTPAQLTDVLQEVDRLLSRQYPLFSVSHTDPGYYYQNRDVTFTKSEKYIYISIKIPVSSSTAYFDIYSLYSLPIPLNGTTANATLITNLPPYFGITRDGEFYTEFSHNIYATC